MANQIVPFSSNLPAFLRGEAAAASELTANVGTGSFGVLSIKGKNFTLSKGGERTKLMNPNDPDEVATSINVVIIKANPNLSKVWYAKGYTEGSDAKPDCYSNDGIAPDASVEKPVAKKCAICPNNQWGSKVGDNGGKGKACQDSRRLAVANVDHIDEPLLLRVPAATLKPLAEYGAALAKRNVPYSAVLTKIGFDPDAPSPKLTFKPVSYLEEDQFHKVKEMSDSDLVASILGKVGASAIDDVELEAAAPAPAPVAKVEAPKPAAKPAAKAKPVVTEDEVGAALGEEAEAPKPAAKKAEPKVVEDALADDLDALLGELDD
jgi:hypothetical protein